MVEDCFKIAGRDGIVVAANRPADLPELKVGNNIVLIQPEGREIETAIGGIEMVLTVSGVKKIAVLVKNIEKADVPAGTEVLLIN